MGNDFYSPPELFQAVYRELASLFRHYKITLLSILILSATKGYIVVFFTSILRFSTSSFFGPFSLLVSTLSLITIIILTLVGKTVLNVFINILLLLLILSRHHQAREKEIVAHTFKLFIPFVIVSLFVTSITTAGFVTLIIPGIIFGFWYMFAPVVLVHEGKRGIEALIQSRKYAEGHVTQLFLNSVFVGMPILLGLITLIVLPFIFPFLPKSIFSLLGSVVGSLASVVLLMTVVLQYERLRQLPSHAHVKVRRWTVSIPTILGLTLLLVLYLALPLLPIINMLSIYRDTNIDNLQKLPSTKKHSFPITTPSPYETIIPVNQKSKS